MPDTHSVISAGLGWTYTVAWACSFVPQILLSWRRKSVVGLSLDFVTLNIVGFISYLVYNLALFSSPLVREQFAARHHGQLPSIKVNDVAFAAWAMASASVVAIQCLVYERGRDQRISTTALAQLVVIAVLITGSLIFIGLHRLVWLDLINVLASVKLYITAAKYVPQVWLNFRRKSTSGFAIGQIVLDAVGGILSISQLFYDGGVNAAKLLLGVIALSFDSIFLTQHYILYGPRNPDEDDERAKLLSDDGV